MTEPTWKDPLLQAWAKASPEDSEWVRNEVEFDASPLDALDALTPYRRDVALRSLIDAELARGREAVEVLREVEWRGDAEPASWAMCRGKCPTCRRYEDQGHAPDCRLARVIASKP